jgi:pyrrolysyl-tRNA synthetase-like protein
MVLTENRKWLGVPIIIKPRPKLSYLISHQMVYPSRNRIIHSVRSVQVAGQYLRISLDCGMMVTVKDSKRGRAARWLNDMIYWTECKNCRFPEKPSKNHPPHEKLRIPPEKKYDRRTLHLGNFSLR